MEDRKYTYTIVGNEIEDGWFMARAPEVPGAVTQGKDRNEAIEMMKEALKLLLESYQANATTSAEAMAIWESVTKVHLPVDRGQSPLESRPCETVTKVHLPVDIPRSALIRHIAKHGCHLDREGGEYSIYSNPKNGRFATVPRRGEIKETLACAICDGLGIART